MSNTRLRHAFHILLMLGLVACIPASAVAQGLVEYAIIWVIVGPSPQTSYELCATNTTNAPISKRFGFRRSGPSADSDIIGLIIDPGETACATYRPDGPGALMELVPAPPEFAASNSGGYLVRSDPDRPLLVGTYPPPGLAKLPTQIWKLDRYTGKRVAPVAATSHVSIVDRYGTVLSR